MKSLSGGQRQSVAIARAVHFNARILIMDEPTAALGPAETAQVRDLITQLKAEGIGIFLISHDIHDVFDLSDRISVMYHGKLVGTVNKAEVTKDEVLAMIILGKLPGEVTEEDAASAPLPRQHVEAAGPAPAREWTGGLRASGAVEDRRERRVQLPVARMDLRVPARRPGRARPPAMHARSRRPPSSTVVNQPAPTAASSAAPNAAPSVVTRPWRSWPPSTSARIWRHTGLARPPPEARISGGHRHPGSRS